MADDNSSNALVEKNIFMDGVTEKRSISKIKVNPSIIKAVFNSVGRSKISFNLMMMTTDQQVLLLERTQSYHFPKVVRDLKSNIVNFNLLRSLYTSELEKIKYTFFNFVSSLPLIEASFPLKERFNTKAIHIFPGGHSSRQETIIWTLLRELREETCLNISVKDLKFNQSCIFSVLIHDLTIQKSFNNFVFPVKVNMNSQDIIQNFKETKHTRNPTFINIKGLSLFEAFVVVQKFMLL